MFLTHVKISHLVDKMMIEQACSKLLTSCNKLVNLSSCNKLVVNKLVTTCQLADLLQVVGTIWNKVVGTSHSKLVVTTC